MNLSEPQLISPLLDGFVMGDPISTHDGVRACPAMLLESEKKYIVKIISLPATQSKLEALLLAGAFADRESALAYFQELADGVTEEANLLQKLSRNEGYVSFDNWQTVPMTDGETGFDIYLLSQYRPTLEGVLRNNEMTHLQAVNLGLDLCAALSVARRFGYLYSNLRPSNVYVCNEREFRIGDLGFLSLDSLQYASLPDKYHSDYTPPEIQDAYSSLNSTMDTYAVGLILYQVYNDGKLPPIGMTLAAPPHADPALAELILKACSLNPEDRWQDPAQMGQALANYLQSNTVNDTPIVPPPVMEEEPVVEEVIPDEDAEPTTEEILSEVDQALEAAPAIIVEPVAEDTAEEPEENTEEASSEEEESSETSAESEDDWDDEWEEEWVDDPEEDEQSSDETEAVPAEEPSNDEIAEPDAEEVSKPVEDVSEPATEEESTEDILAQADDLIAHELPEPPVAPEPIEVTLPVPEETSEEPEAEDAAESDDDDWHDEDFEDDEDEEDDSYVAPVVKKAPVTTQKDDTKHKKQRKTLIALICVLAVVLLLGIGGYLFYENYYIQMIDNMVIAGSEDKLSVVLDTEIPDSKLTVRCVDTHGNALSADVNNGIATFSGLRPGATYKLEVRIEGFHKLTGKTTGSYTTDHQTTINGFYATAGNEGGTVVLSFIVQGPDAEYWNVTYSAEGEPERTAAAYNHNVILTGLKIGKEYTFHLSPATDLYVGGTQTITYTLDAQSVENLRVETPDRNQLSVLWDSLGDIPTGGWMLKYSVDGSAEQSIACMENTASISPLIPGGHYTFTLLTADGAEVLGGTLEYSAPAAVPFSGFNVTADKMEFFMCKTPDRPNWTHKQVSTSDYTKKFELGKKVSFVMHLLKATPKDDTDVITLYVVPDAEGKLIGTGTETQTWDAMWDNRWGELTSPIIPEVPGTYSLEVYFDGMSAITETFEVVAAN